MLLTSSREAAIAGRGMVRQSKPTRVSLCPPAPSQSLHSWADGVSACPTTYHRAPSPAPGLAACPALVCLHRLTRGGREDASASPNSLTSLPKQGETLIRRILSSRRLRQGGQAVKRALLTAPEMRGGTSAHASASRSVSVMGHPPNVTVPGLLLANRNWSQAKHGSPAPKFRLGELLGSWRRRRSSGHPATLSASKTRHPHPACRGDAPSQWFWPGSLPRRDKQHPGATPLDSHVALLPAEPSTPAALTWQRGTRLPTAPCGGLARGF